MLRRPRGKGRAKAPSLLKHSLRRLGERFGLGVAAHAEAVAQIQDGRATFVERQSNRVSVFDVVLDSKTVRVIYDRQRGQLVTVLPEVTND